MQESGSPPQVHPTAIVDPRAILAPGVVGGAYSVIEGVVELGRDVAVHSHAFLKGPLWVGEGTTIHHGAIVGADPQDLTWGGETGGTVLGARCTIREYASVHTATAIERRTVLGDEVYMMAYSHVGHDCQVGNGVTMASTCFLSGHARVEDHVTFSGGVYIHQFCRVGRLAMISALSAANQDIPPFTIVGGRPARVLAINRVGLKRAGVLVESRDALKQAYKALFRRDGTGMRDTCNQLLEGEPDEIVAHLARFILDSERGVCSEVDAKTGQQPGL
jgi:UDP-N-acetylglucosamine acyltransferase